MAVILAIESSCDETAVAIIKDGVLLSNIVSTQIEVHRKYGGVMPEIASRLHAENISIVLKEAVETANIKLEDVDAFEAVFEAEGVVVDVVGRGDFKCTGAEFAVDVFVHNDGDAAAYAGHDDAFAAKPGVALIIGVNADGGVA